VVGGTGDADRDRDADLIKCSGESSFAAAASSALGLNLPALGMNWVDVLRVKPYLDTSFFCLPCTGRFQYVWSPNSLSVLNCLLIC
jgi:hypothetical protein